MTTKIQMRENSAACYVRNKAEHRKIIRARQDGIRRWWREYKQSVRCSRCPEWHPACLDFHHVASNKEIGIADAVRRGWSISRIEKEIAKCIVLCANCHRKEHSKP